MRSKAIFMALLAFAFGAQAAFVSSDTARSAARAWVLRGSGSFRASANVVVEKVSSHEIGGDVSFYAVKMSGGGTVFVSGDTMVGPIIAFAPSSADFSKIDKSSPLWALLQRDAAIRGLGDPERAQEAWGELLSDPAMTNGAGDAVPGHVNCVTELDDVRVRPLVQSRWNQGNVGDHPCFNRFTPVLSDGKNAVCGCVATAMAQLMRYHRFPVEARVSVTNKCTVEAARLGNPAAVTNLVTQGGIYDWANMPIVPDADDPNIEAQCEAIGRLTSDAGIAVGMNYDLKESGAFSFNIAPALMEVFGYANAEYYRASESRGFPTISADMERAMFANLDAGYPVLMGISGAGGHQIVGDGYGYKDGQPYVHLNMGWGSVDDVWYNLPQIDCETSGLHFTVFQDIVFNVFPVADKGDSILSGRIIDENGASVSNVTVTVRRAGDDALVAEAVDQESGVFGFRVPTSAEGDRFVIRAVSADGAAVGLTDGVLVVRASQTTLKDCTGLIDKDSGWTKTYPNRPVVTDVGNSWGNSLTVVPAPVRIGMVPYAFLDEALDAVADGADVIEVLRPVCLRVSRTVAAACAIVATNDDPSASAVTRVGDAALTVADGGWLSMSNLVFAAGSNTVVNVKAGGHLEVAGAQDFGVVPAGVPAVRTAAEDGFVLGGGLSGRVVLACEAARDIGEVFGSASCGYESAMNGVRWIESGYDPDAELMAVAVTNLAGDIFLAWSECPVSLESCAGFYVDASGTTNTAANLDRVFEKYEQSVAAGAGAGPHEIVITGNGRMLGLTRPHEVKTGLTIRTAEPGIVLSNFTETAGITISANGALTVEGLEFRGYRGEGLFIVDGADASLVVSNSTFCGIVGTGSHSGAISILAGSAFAYDSIFEDCKAGDPQLQYGATPANGGAIYLKGVGCELHLCGGTITGCRALKSGGGVYVGIGATLGISGDLQVRGNIGTDGADDIYVGGKDKNGEAYSLLMLEGALGVRTDAIGVKYAGSNLRGGYGNYDGAKFIDISGAVAVDEVARMSGIRTIFSDVDSTLDRVYDETSRTLKWTTTASSRKVDVGPVKLSGCSASANGDYAFLADAVEAIDGDGAVIQVKGDVVFADMLTISNAVSILGDGERTVSRVGDVSVKVVGGGSLDLGSVIFDGGNGTIRLFDIDGGEMALNDGAVVRNVKGFRDRASGGVVVQNHGVFTMNGGSAIVDCVNAFTDDGSKAGYCGGLLVDNSKAQLHGGTVSGCMANGTGGIFVGNGSEVSISGAFTNIDNRVLSGELSNLKVADKSKLYLDGPFTGFCGYTEGAQGDTRQFGEIEFDGTAATYAESAHRFTHDVTRDIGQAVIGSVGKLLVWNDALDNKTYTDGKGNVYTLVEGGDPIFIAVPQAKTDLVYTGEEQVGVEDGFGYSIVGNAATDAGVHVATATPKFGYAWVGGSANPADVDWTIAKCDFNLDGVEFPSDEFICDGRVKSLNVKGEPDGITVTYENNDQTAVGEYEVKAFLTGGDGNHNPTSVTMTATLRIVKDPQADPPGPVPPGPEYEVVTNKATKIAFSEISHLDANTWRLVVTDRVEKCVYRLLSTEDLTAGFTATDDWQVAEASGPWTNVLTRSAAAVFWRAEGADTVTTNYLNSTSEGE